ncbi:MAG: FHA domain-containing protein [Anaerolineae bacterium]|nr:FHA domain-containing protein [Anaerolineae bacterium]
MRSFIAWSMAFVLAFAFAGNVNAQTSDSIWLTAGTTAFKTGENVTVTVNAVSTTPIQGFTFQIRYDPACLKPVNASSPVAGMNGLPLPQLSGLVDGSYASTTPQTVNGVLAEVRFVTLKGCQTNLNLESAALAIRTTEGFAAPLAGVAIGERNIALNIDKEAGIAQPPQQESGSVLSLAPPPVAERGFPGWAVGILVVLLVAGMLLGAFLWLRTRNAISAAPMDSALPRGAALHMKHGPYAGKSFVLNKLPIMIGRDPQNDICLNDPHIIPQHARIFETSNGYYLMDLGGETYVNGQMVRRNSTFLQPGDVVRLGKSALFVFGPS